MPPNPKAEPDVDILYTQLQRRLVESGEWDRIQSLLKVKLSESGWTDDLRHRSKEIARPMDPLSFQNILKELSPHVQTSMPLAVKREITTVIRRYLEKQFE